MTLSRGAGRGRAFIAGMNMIVKRGLPARIAETTDAVREILAVPPTAELRTHRFAAGLTEESIREARAAVAHLENRERRVRNDGNGDLAEVRGELGDAHRLLGDLATRLAQQRTAEAHARAKAGPSIAAELAPHIDDAIRQALEGLAAVELALDPISEAVAFASANAVPIPRETAKATDLAAKLVRQIRVTLGSVNGGLR